MPYGKHKGERMADVPAAYLLWLYDNDKCTTDVAEYIENNIEVLENEMYLNM